MGSTETLIDRLGETHAFQHDRRGRIAQRVTGFGFGHRHQGDDVTGAGFFDRISFLGEHFDHAANLFTLAARRVHHRGALGEHTRINANKGQRAVGIVDHFEGQGRERLVIGTMTFAIGLAVGVDRLDRFDVCRGRQQIDDGVENLLNALVLVGRAAENRREGRQPACPCGCRCAECRGLGSSPVSR